MSLSARGDDLGLVVDVARELGPCKWLANGRKMEHRPSTR